MLLIGVQTLTQVALRFSSSALLIVVCLDFLFTPVGERLHILISTTNESLSNHPARVLILTNGESAA